MPLNVTIENTQECYITGYWFMFDVCCEGYFPFTVGLNENKQSVNITLIPKDNKKPILDLLVCYELGLNDIIVIDKNTFDLLVTKTQMSKELRTSFFTARFSY